MFRNPFEFRFEPFGRGQSRKLFGYHTTPREWKHGARDIPFGMGAQTLYVDGTNGHDSNDGESWKTAKKTIQEAVDTADAWTQIFIKAGTYAENVSISDDSIHLIGQSRDSVLISPTSGSALTISGDGVTVQKISLHSAQYTFCALLSGENLTLDTIRVHEDTYRMLGIKLTTPNRTVLNRIYATDANAIHVEGTAKYLTISNCKFDYTTAYGYEYIYLEDVSESEIYNNDFNVRSNSYGVYVWSGCSRLNVFHNNFYGDGTYLYDLGTYATFFENFYDSHTNVDNGFGIATEPYTFTNGTDLRPVVCRSGWNSISVQRSLLRKKTAAQTSQAATDANGTSWVDLKTIAPTTSDIELYRIKMTTGGSWAGTAKYRIIIGSTKVYPFGDDKDIDSGVLEDFIFPITVQINETCKIQFRSTDSGDGAGETVTLNQLDYALVV